jgi:hypothetical protein
MLRKVTLSLRHYYRVLLKHVFSECICGGKLNFKCSGQGVCVDCKKRIRGMNRIPKYNIHDLIEFLVKHPEKTFYYGKPYGSFDGDNYHPCLMVQFFKWKHKDCSFTNHFGVLCWNQKDELIAKFNFPDEFKLEDIHLDKTTSHAILEKISHYGWL